MGAGEGGGVRTSVGVGMEDVGMEDVEMDVWMAAWRVEEGVESGTKKG